MTGCEGASSPTSGGGGQRSEEPPSAPEPPPSASAADAAEEEALAAYRGMWEDMARAGESSDWRAPYLADHARGAALETITGSLYADHRNGLVTRGEPVLDPEVTSAEPPDEPSTVMVEDCGDSSDWLKYQADTGELAEGETGGRRAITAEVERQADGAWQVTRFAVEGLGSC